MTLRPPHIASRFLAWFCPSELHEGVAGDLAEQYELDAASLGERRAGRRYTWGVLRFFRLGIIFRHYIHIPKLQPAMLQNYLKVGFRNLRKHWLNTAIHTVGLSIGVALCLLIYLYLQDEARFDQFHSKKDRIVRLHDWGLSKAKMEAGDKDPRSYSPHLQAPLAAALLAEVPEVEKVTFFSAFDDFLISYDGSHYRRRIAYVSPDFFDMFDFRLESGNRSTVLRDINEVVLTRETARQIFKEQDPIGKTLLVNIFGSDRPFTVAGIIENPPPYSSLDFDFLINVEQRPFFTQNLIRWFNKSYPIFVQLREGADPGRLQASLDRLHAQHLGEAVETMRQRSFADLPEGTAIMGFGFVPLPEIHLAHKVDWYKVSNPQNTYILGGIAVLILLIACVNYVTLALASSMGRRKEVGVRKSMGAGSGSLTWQFVVESLLVAFASMTLAVFLALAFLNAFNQFTGKHIAVGDIDLLQVAGMLGLITLVVGLGAGVYPAFVLARSNAIAALKSAVPKLRSRITKPLVVFQFAAAAFLMICAGVMYEQMNYVSTKDLGYTKETVVVVSTQQADERVADETIERLRFEMGGIPDVVSLAGTSSSFNRGWSSTTVTHREEERSVYIYKVDPYYLETMGIELLQGRNFIGGSPADSSALIVNEAFVKAFGLEQPVGERIDWPRQTGSAIIGVVKDHHFLSLETEIRPMALILHPNAVGYMHSALVRIRPGSLPGVLDDMRATWAKLEPDKPFEYTFLDADVAQHYTTYENWKRIMGLSTFFAILVACLGLFGLAGVNAVNRTKEIGVRKVLGASVQDILLLLNRPFLWLVLLAFVVAIPVAIYAMGQWLGNFEYAVGLDWRIFVAAVGASVILALATVSFHAFRAASVNPVETLKCE